MNDPPSIDQAFIQKLKDIVLANLTNEGFGVEQLAKEVGMSRTNLYRRLISIRNQDVSKFIREVRLQRAMDFLRNKLGTAAEISYMVGFGSPTYFNKCFHEYYGFPPGEVKKREVISIGGEDADKLTSISGQGQLLKPQKRGTLAWKHSSNRKRVIIFSGIFAALVLFGLFYFVFPNTSKEKSIIVLPFKNFSEEKETEYFACGLTEDILNHLFRISDLSVRSRTTSEYFQENTLTAREIARQVNARYVLEGSVRRYDNKVRITVQLIDAKSDHHIWSKNFDRNLTDILGIQGEIALEVALKLDAVLTDNEITQIEKIPTRSLEAYDFYLKGRFLLNSTYSEQRADIEKEGYLGGLQFFEKAISADNNFAEAYAGLARAYFTLNAWGMLPYSEGGFLKTRDLCVRALEIDPDCKEAHAVRGALYIWGERKFEDGRKELLISLKLNPNSPIIHQWYAQLLMITGPIEDARIHMDNALEIEPYFWVLHNLNAWIYYFEDKYDKAIDACYIAQDLKSDFIFNNWLLFLNYTKLGKGAKAVAELQTIVRLSGNNQYDDELMDFYNKSGIEGLYAWLIEVNMNKSVRGVGLNGHPFYISWWEAILGNKEKSIYWLERNMKAHNRHYQFFNLIALNPDFDLLRDDPRFLAIIDQIGLTPYNTRSVEPK